MKTNNPSHIFDSLGTALAQGFQCNDSQRRLQIVRGNEPGHRDADDIVALLQYCFGNPIMLAADDEHDITSQVDIPRLGCTDILDGDGAESTLAPG